MMRRPPRSTRTDTLFPYTPLFRSKLAPNDPRAVIARLKRQADAPIRTDTRAKLSMTSLTGSPIIQLTGGDPSSPRLTETPGSEVPIILTEPSALQNIADTANRLVERLDKVLSEENVERIAGTLENIESLTGSIADQREDLSALIVNARKASEQLNTTLDSTNRAISAVDREFVQKLERKSRRLDSTLANLDSAAGGADQIHHENRGAIRSFANDGLSQLGPPLGELRTLLRDRK